MLTHPQPGDQVIVLDATPLPTPFKDTFVTLDQKQYEVLYVYPDGQHVYLKGTPGKWRNERFELVK